MRVCSWFCAWRFTRSRHLEVELVRCGKSRHSRNVTCIPPTPPIFPISPIFWAFLEISPISSYILTFSPIFSYILRYSFEKKSIMVIFSFLQWKMYKLLLLPSFLMFLVGPWQVLLVLKWAGGVDVNSGLIQYGKSRKLYLFHVWSGKVRES